MSRWASILSMSGVSVLPLGCSKYSRRYSLTMCFWAEAGQAYGAATCVSVAAPHGTLVPLNSWVMLSNVTEPPGDASRDIPDPIRRAVRQRCGFGCVICGLPLYTYEHMLGWATVQRHVADEMTLLCDKHQRERTNGLLPISDVQAANQDPFNRRSGTSAPYALHYSGDYCQVDIGSNVLTARMMGYLVAVQVDGEPLVGFRFEDGHYLLNVLLFNEVNEPVLQILDNELIYSSEPWDIELVGNRLTVRAAARSIFIDIVFEPPATVRFLRGRLLLNGIELYIRPTFIILVNSADLIRQSTASGSSIGLNIGYDERPSAFRFRRVPRYQIGRRAALRRAKEQVKEQDWDLSID